MMHSREPLDLQIDQVAGNGARSCSRNDARTRNRLGCRACSRLVRVWGAFVAAALLALTGTAAPATAQVRLEVEADPFAYVLNGFSIHGAGILDRYRLSVGTFGIDVPRAFHGNDGWSVSMRGAGVKVDLLGSRIDGFFVGADANYYRMSYTLDEADETSRRNEVGVGIRGGYRHPVGRSGLYVAPWVGVGYTFSDGDVEVGEHTFDSRKISIFPTVHIGWRF